MSANGQSRKDKQAIYRLRQYFMASQAIKAAWQDRVRTEGRMTPISDVFSPNDGKDIEPLWHLMRHRFASLVPVIEGWRRLRLSDLKVNVAIAAPETRDDMRTLEAFRNSVYHYSPDAWDERDREFLAHGMAEGAMERVVRLEEAFDTYFGNWQATTDLTGIGHWQTVGGP